MSSIALSGGSVGYIGAPPFWLPGNGVALSAYGVGFFATSD